MPPVRRLGSEQSTTRDAILDATARIMVEEGYAAVTSRRVAARVGMHAGNVHYYFPTVDDLFVAVLERESKQRPQRIAEALASPTPIASLWRLATDTSGVGLMNEMVAAANHRKVLRTHLTEIAHEVVQMQNDALRDVLPTYEIDPELFPAELVSAAVQALSLMFVRSAALGVAADHDPAVQAAERLIEHLESRRRPG